MKKIPKGQWKWFGNAGHFICAHNCQFHMTTQVGGYLVSTVGQYMPDSAVREILARSRGIELEGRGDERDADWTRKAGYEEIGCDRLFETMVFETGDICQDPGCGCGLPSIVPSELDFEGYNTAGRATDGHYAMCERWADPIQRTALLGEDQ